MVIGLAYNSRPSNSQLFPNYRVIYYHSISRIHKISRLSSPPGGYIDSEGHSGRKSYNRSLMSELPFIRPSIFSSFNFSILIVFKNWTGCPSRIVCIVKPLTLPIWMDDVNGVGFISGLSATIQTVGACLPLGIVRGTELESFI